MSENKNIDTFFKERLEPFEMAPPEMAWKNIEAKLNEKKEKRRVIPFWCKLSGIAAILLVGFGLYSTYFNSNSVPNHPIVNQQNTTPNNSGGNDISATSSDTTTNKETIVQSQSNANANITNDVTTTNSATEKKRNTAISNQNQKNNVATVADSNDNKKTKSSNDLASATHQLDSEKKKQNSTKNKFDSKKETTVTSIATTSVKESTTNKLNNTVVGVTDSTVDKNNNINPKTALSISENLKITRDGTSDSELAKQAERSEVKHDEIKKIDSTEVATVEPNALEELLNEKEKKIAQEPKLNRWQVTPNIAPIYFSSISNGSPLDEKLAANQKIYGTNYSYGLSVNYALNKKYSLRAGIHSYSVDYDTKNIVFYQDSNPSKMQNLNPNSQGSSIQIDPLSNVNSSFGRIAEDKFEGTLNQKMGYIEIPLEVSYQLLSKKLGIDVIGGLSTLFLSQNDVYLKSSDFNIKIGEASNLNTVHFSTNIGLGMKYSLLKQLDARLEPIFKYQINTYSSGAGNFKPYIFGIYTGLTYHF